MKKLSKGYRILLVICLCILFVLILGNVFKLFSKADTFAIYSIYLAVATWMYVLKLKRKKRRKELLRVYSENIRQL